MIFLFFILGASIGSFLNVLIDRLPKNQSILGRSRCDFCKKKIAWYDLIPIVSYFILKGKSRCCYKKLSFQYPLVETITGLIFVFLFKGITDSFLLRTILVGGIISSLIVIFFSDLKYHLISDYILWAFFIFSLLFKISTANFFGAANNIILFKETTQSIISGLFVVLPIFLIYYISHERAMGLGDVYLSAIIGFLLGWKEGFIALYIAFITGAIFGLILIITRKKKLKSKIAFGPFLVIGTIVMLFFADKVWYLIYKIYNF